MHVLQKLLEDESGFVSAKNTVQVQCKYLRFATVY
jgi:hypothetical protein